MKKPSSREFSHERRLFEYLLREPVENQRRWEGTLAGFSDGVITLEPTPGKSLRIGLQQIEKANLKFEW